jgi:hypothetical protein
VLFAARRASCTARSRCCNATRHCLLCFVQGGSWDLEHAIREHCLSSTQRLATQVDHGSDQPYGSGKERSPDTSIRTISRGAPGPAAHATDTND